MEIRGIGGGGNRRSIGGMISRPVSSALDYWFTPAGQGGGVLGSRGQRWVGLSIVNSREVLGRRGVYASPELVLLAVGVGCMMGCGGGDGGGRGTSMS